MALRLVGGLGPSVQLHLRSRPPAQKSWRLSRSGCLYRASRRLTFSQMSRGKPLAFSASCSGRGFALLCGWMTGFGTDE